MDEYTCKGMTAVYNSSSGIHTLESENINILVVENDNSFRLEFSIKVSVLDGIYRDNFCKTFTNCDFNSSLLLSISTLLYKYCGVIKTMKKCDISAHNSKEIVRIISGIISNRSTSFIVENLN